MLSYLRFVRVKMSEKLKKESIEVELKCVANNKKKKNKKKKTKKCWTVMSYGLSFQSCVYVFLFLVFFLFITRNHNSSKRLKNISSRKNVGRHHTSIV